MIGLVVSILGGIVVLLMGFFARQITERIRGRTGVLAGRWKQVIEQELHREDIVKCAHMGDNVQGSIRRAVPDLQRNRRWRFWGKKKGEFVFLLFWNLNDRENPDSSGTIQLHMVGPNHLEGFYVKSVLKPHLQDANTLVRAMTTTKLVWIRQHETVWLRMYQSVRKMITIVVWKCKG